MFSSHSSLAVFPQRFQTCCNPSLSEFQDLTLPPSWLLSFTFLVISFLLYPSLLSSSLFLVLSFSLDSRWGLHADRLALGKGQTYARSVPGLSLLQAADRTLTSCHLTSDLLVADLAVTQGKHYWACSVEPGSYLVKVWRDGWLLARWFWLNVLHIENQLYLTCWHIMDQSFLPFHFSLLQVGVGQEAKLQEWFHLPQDMASPR